MKNRIKNLRKELNLTQQEFADKIGISRGNIGAYEVGKNIPSDAVISLICREFDVREEWLRTGEGEMFKPKPSDILDQLAYKYQFSNADYVIAEKFISLRPEKRREIFGKVFDFLHEVESALSDTDPYVPAYTETKPSQPMDGFIESYKILKSKDAIPEISIEQAESEYIKKISGIAQKKESTASSTTSDTRKLSNE